MHQRSEGSAAGGASCSSSALVEIENVEENGVDRADAMFEDSGLLGELIWLKRSRK